MDKLLYWPVRGLVALLQALPLVWVARLGRAGGALAYWLDARHRRVAMRNLTMCLGGEKSPAEIRDLARENFRRLGENYAGAVKTAAMSLEELRAHVEFVGDPQIVSRPAGSKPPTVVVAIGHFGNFELYARFGQFVPAFQCVTTYRGLRQPSLNRLMQSLRARSGCLFFERRFEGTALKALMREPGIMLGLLCDQHAGRNGLHLTFLGYDCAASPAPAVFALRYHCPLHTAICFRIAPGRWRVEISEAIPTSQDGRQRLTKEIMSDVHRAFETAVRRDPANWFWVHNRWKGGVKSEILPQGGTDSETKPKSEIQITESEISTK